MKIDFNTITIAGHTGYGNASRLLVDSLEGRGVFMHPGSAVMLNFCMPKDYKYSDITIGYTPWESTEVPRDWLEGLRKVDDLWTTSSWVADVFHAYRPGAKAFVVPHGIEDCWVPVKRYRRPGPFNFVHVGEPAERKGGDILLKAWYKHFRHRNDVHLTFKCVGYPIARVKDRGGSILASPGSLNNTSLITNVWTQDEMLDFYYGADCLVYPTRGEGFGLIPFEAMATGLPTILPATGGTRDFAYMSPLTMHNSMWVNSTEERIHPGLWLDHDEDELIFLMEEAIENYQDVSEHAFQSASAIHDGYSWSSVAERVQDRIETLL